ncbi:MAG: NAD(+) kinase [Promethearchaeota archaeon]
MRFLIAICLLKSHLPTPASLGQDSVPSIGKRLPQVSNNQPKRVGLACRLDKPAALQLARDVLKFLLSRNVGVALESRIAQKLGQPSLALELSKMTNPAVDLIVSIGGDGTILRVAQSLVQKNSAPLLGINVGSVGFLDEATVKTARKTLTKVMDGKYTLQLAPRLHVSLDNKRLPDALNEAYLCSARASKILKFSINVDHAFLADVFADGVLVSTSCGSTAYSMSAGGAIVDPRVSNVMQIVPVCPFARRSLRPIVIPGSSEVEISLLRSRLTATLVIDGQFECPVMPRKKLRIKRSKRPLKFVRVGPLHRNFYDRLRTILLPPVENSRDLKGSF